MIIDTHTHLTLCHHLSLPEHFALCERGGITHMLDPGLWVDDFAERFGRLKEYGQVQMGIALAPHSVEPKLLGESAASIDGALEELEGFLRAKETYRITALSEIGLDFFYTQDATNHQVQEEIFRRQLELAEKYDLPVFLHIRDAYDRTLELIQASGIRRGAVHCFTGNAHDAQSFLELGFYLSFSGIVTFKNARTLQAIAATTPLNRLLSETDAPYLSPHPLRGQKNNSSHLIHTNRFLAGLKHISEEEMNNTLFDNAKKLIQF